MSWLTGAAKQVFGLFVDDGALSLAICVWLLLVAFLLSHVGPASARPLILFAGLALLLLDSIRRGASAATHT